MSDALAAALMMQAQQGRGNDTYSKTRKMGEMLMAQGSQNRPTRHWMEDVNNNAQKLLGGFLMGKADDDQKTLQAATADKYARALGAPDEATRMAILQEGGGDPQAMIPLYGALLSGKMADERKNAAYGTAYKAAGGTVPGAVSAPTSLAPPGGYQQVVGRAESNNNPQAVNPTSGAAGQFQFMPETWAGVRQSNPELNLPDSPLKATPQQQAAAEEKFRAGNAQALQSANIPVNDVTLYVAHRAGAKGAQTILSADPNAPMASIVPQSWVQQNPDMRGTVGDFLKGATSKFGGGAAPQAPGVTVPATPPQAGAPQAPQMPEISPAAETFKRQAEEAWNSGDKSRAVALAQKAQEVQATYAQERAVKMDERNFAIQTEQRKAAADAPQKNFDNAAKIRDDFEKQPAVKSYREVVPIMESARTAVSRPTRAADLNLIYGLGKIMDPASVVREGEMVMARGTGTVSDTIRGYLGMLDGAPTLQPATRQKIIDEMQSRFGALEQSHNSLADAYGGIADRAGIKREDVIIPIRQPKPAGETPAGPRKLGANGEGYDEVKPGEQYVGPDGQMRVKGGG